MFKKIAVFGPGLLGGSLCKAVKKLFPGTEIFAYGRSRAKLQPVLGEGTADAIGTMDEAVLTGVDFIVVALPAVSSVELIRSILDRDDLEPHAIVSDVGSVKGEIIREIGTHAKAAQFVGCHPMAGSEKTGYEQSSPGLYAHAWVIITPHGQNSREDVGKVKLFWEALSARTALVPADEHDVMVSLTSHAPHIASCALMKMLNGKSGASDPNARYGAFIGSGFRDVTRLASGSPDMWRDICLMNKDNILEAVSALIDELDGFRALMNSGEDISGSIYSYFSEIKRSRDAL